MKRKLLSLLMVFVLLCGMLPMALAADEVTTPPEETEEPGGGNTSHTHNWGDGQVTAEPGCETAGVKTYTCSADNCPDKTMTETISPLGHSYGDWEVVKAATCAEKGSRTRKCTRSNCDKTETEAIEKLAHTPSEYTGISATEHRYTCSVCQEVVTENHTLPCDKCKYVAPGTTYTLIAGASPTSSSVSIKRNDYENFSVDPALSPSGSGITLSDISYTWKLNSKSLSVTKRSCSVYESDLSSGTNTLTCDISAKGSDGKTYTTTASWKLTSAASSADIDVSATVYNTNTGYALGDTDDAGGKSIVSKINSALGSKEYIDYLQFSSVSEKNKGSLDCSTKTKLDEDELEDVEFEPDEDYTGSVSFEFTLKTNKDTYSGVMTFTVKKGTASNAKGDINYTGVRGSEVYFDADDFEDFFTGVYKKGDLDYVVFNRASNGTVYYDGKKTSTSDYFYSNPRGSRKDLDGVSFEPSSSTFTGTATVTFTAYGYDSSDKERSVSGTVAIVYSGANAKDINYQVASGYVRLNPDNFVSTYKTAAGVTSSNPTMYIRFTNLPSKGSLYVNYTASGGGSRVSTGTYYSSKSSASNYIGDITYVPGAAGGSETIEYTAYSTDSASGLKYSGKINFTAPAAASERPVTVSYRCTGGSVNFTSADFSGSSESMALIDYLTFGTPSNGALYTNYAGGTGDRVLNSNLFAYYSLPSMGYQRIDAVTYVPPLGWSGTASVPFTAYLVGGGTISGTVSIAVTAAAATALKDVPSSSWYAVYVSDLLAAGVLSGYEDNTFRPANNVTYGEILKLVMLATGYSEQPKTGAHWASGFVDRALADGLISERVDPDAFATRAAVADIAAKAMGLRPITDGVSPFTDSANGFVRALYSAGIIDGYEEGGRVYYRGENRIERTHIAKIIWNIMHYNGTPLSSSSGNTSTPTTPSRPDTEIPDWLKS